MSLASPVVRHFSDTRTAEGRVRFVMVDDQVYLMAEGPGWQHNSCHPDLTEAALYLALLDRLSPELYASSLEELQRRLMLEAA